jgi:rhomboid protease GluP
MYALAQEGLQAADRQMTAWRVLMQFGQPAAVTLGLLAMLVVIFAVDTVVFTQWLDAPLWWWVGNVPEDVVQGQWWRPVTALLLHASLLHLAMNAVAVWMFGSAVERTLGWWRMPVIFFVAGTLGNFASVLRGGFDVSVGASSGLFGLVAAYVVAVYRLDMPVVASARRRLLVMLGMMVATDLMIGWLEPQVDGVAHAGGFVAGLLLTLVLRPRW